MGVQHVSTNTIKRTDHAVKLHELPDEYLADALPIAKKIALAQGLKDYNILQVCPFRHQFFSFSAHALHSPQNNGRAAHQQVDHVHFHIIPKPKETEGLVLSSESWPSQSPSKEELKAYQTELLGKLDGKL